MKKSILLLLILVGVSFWLMFGRSTVISPDQRKTDLFQASLRAEPLIQAIRGYAIDKKRPPKQLNDLIPLYIAEIPETGLQGCNWFKYVNYADSSIVVLWYDLGSRHGKPVAKESRFSDGDLGHSILVLTIGANENVIDAKLDRMPKEFQPVEFDQAQWLANRNRISMAPGLPEKYAIENMSRPVLEDLLGKPDGERILRDTPWELRINCPRNLTERDIFIYWPTENYPAQIYGGNSELVGKWLYVQ